MSAGNRVTVTKRFVADFDKVCDRYGLNEAERKEAKQAARNDLDNAIVCFSALAQEEA